MICQFLLPGIIVKNITGTVGLLALIFMMVWVFQAEFKQESALIEYRSHVPINIRYSS